MSSLWTPGGEHKITRPGDKSPTPTGPDEPGGGSGMSGPRREGPGGPPANYQEEYGAFDPADLNEQEMAEMQAITGQLLAAPPEDVIANHVYGFFELAALHMSQQPPNLEAARLPIDAMALLVDGLGERLGSNAVALSEGLNQIRLAYVRIANATTPASD